MQRGSLIGEVSQRVGVAPSAIRYYERLGLLDPPERSESHYRLFTEEDETSLLFIKQAKLFGLSLGEIKEIMDLRARGIAPCRRLKKIIEDQMDDLDERIRKMVEFRDELARWHEQLDATGEMQPGRICGLIERKADSQSASGPV